ncbi:MAG: class I SAM-dependent methyltransferase [Phycisphaeraceae bacterium]
MPTSTPESPVAVHQMPADFEHVPCLLCQADEPKVAVEGTRVHGDHVEPFTVVRCGKCDHLYLNPRPRLDVLGRYYEDAYYTLLEDAPKTSPKKLRRERRAQAALRQHFNYPGDTPKTFWRKLWTLPTALWLKWSTRAFDALPWAGQGKLCDFGCGGCGFLRQQRDRGWDVCGVDFSEGAATRAIEEDKLDVAVGTWPGPAREGETFDVITGFHVIEHLPDPEAWVRAAAAKLNPGGYFLICCPDADSWAYKKFKQDWYGLDPPRHFSNFTKAKVAGLMKAAGLEVVRIRPQSRDATLLRSAALRAKRTGSGWWKFLSGSKIWWKPVALLSGWFAKADGMVITARKPV